MKLADIPNSNIRPVDAEPSKVRELLQSQAIRRRGILKGIVGAGMVLGISALDLLPGRNKAHADLVGSPPWQFWNQCTDFPAAWKDCNTAGDSQISQLYCQPANLARHRVDYVETNNCNWTDYSSQKRCNGVNAWRWYKSEGPDTGPPSVVCSDGWVYKSVQCRTSNFKSTCRHYL